MGLTEAVPLPWHGVEPEEVPQDHGIGAGMGDDDHALVRVVDVPQSPIRRVERVDTVTIHRCDETFHDTLMEVPKRLPTGDAVPHRIDLPEVGRLERLLDLLDRLAMPFLRVLDLFEPFTRLPDDLETFCNRTSGLGSSVHRRHPDFIDTFDLREASANTCGLLTTELGQVGVAVDLLVRSEVGLPVSDKEQIHTVTLRCGFVAPTQYDGLVANTALVEHLREHALRTDGPFTLRSGAISDWYLDARQTTFDGSGAVLVGSAVLDVLDGTVRAVGGMTMGADPIAVATAMVAAQSGRDLKAFSIRKEAKDHGTGGRLVGPVDKTMPVAILEDTTTTGGAAVEAAAYLLAEGFEILQAIAVVDRSEGRAAANFADLGIPHVGLVRPVDLGVDL